mmetsp:Transcript_150546/g.273946  ORF Transcript_150546/g.273946 Transcript_150546/m.273946 type:complete len:359 (-) Transcript_150546:155-1231(-)
MTMGATGDMMMGIASDSKAAAISVIQSGVVMGSSSTNKSADAWQGFYAALMSLKSCSHPSCGTPSTAMTEASLSEIGSSHGDSPSRKLGRDTEMEEDMSDTDASDIDPIEEDSDLIQSPSSKRSRHRNRRHRTRGGRRSAARRAKLRAAAAAACDKIDEEPAPSSVAASVPSSQFQLLSDLGLHPPTVTVECPAESKMPDMPAGSPGPVCFTQVSAHAVHSSAGPGNLVGTSPGTASAGSDASARIPAIPLVSSPCFAHQQLPNFIPATSTAHLAPHGSCAVLLISPCHAWSAPAGGIVSTSPMTAPGGPCSSANVAMAGAGSQSADALRSWLQASGLSPAADIVAQLQAAAPEFYED